MVVGSVIGGGLWLEKQRTERRMMEAVRHDAEPRNEVGTAVAQAVSFRNGFHFSEARALLEQARDPLGPAGRQLEHARADLDLAERLEQARGGTLALSGGRYDPSEAEDLYSAALADAGFGREGDDSNAVAARIQLSALRAEIVAGLEANVLRHEAEALIAPR
jgi:hypothetical protein